MKTRGFTLLEVLIALSIFTLIGLGANHVLRTVIHTRDITQSYANRFAELQRTLAVMERDLVQLIDRPIRDELGDPRAALLVGQDPYLLEFTRAGWRNPAQVNRSDLQRVAYSFSDGNLLRHYWIVLDRAEDSQPVTQKLLTAVEGFEVDVITSRGDVTYLWPEESDQFARPDVLPARLELIIGIKNLGEIRKLINLVAVAPQGQNQTGGGPDGDDLTGAASGGTP